MGISRDDLYRALPSIFQQQPYKIKDDSIIAKKNQRSLVINILKEDVRKLASMKVPRLVLDFCFENYTQAQVTSFEKRFLLHLQKGGG